AADPVFSLSSQTMKTSGFQTFPSVSDPVAETTGNNKFNERWGGERGFTTAEAFLTMVYNQLSNQ
ncbi:MAG: hypothetical protein O7C75_09085, partial [Verrucomicrobia bacterium]|nr:hypothetical protein [Verrucomicrobiota bacterium]